MKNWFQGKEEVAGVKRLVLTWKIYQIFGKFPVRIITFFVGLSAFLVAGERRNAINNYFKILFRFTKNKKYDRKIANTTKIFLNFANSLADKMFLLANDFDEKNVSFAEKAEQDEVLDLINCKMGMFFISTHLGCIEIMRLLLCKKDFNLVPKVNIFMQKNACEIFNNFLKTIQSKETVEIFAVEKIDIATSILISEKLQHGEIVFMAGDRVSAQNENSFYKADILGEKVNLPLGTLKFAQMLKFPIFFAICAKSREKYLIHTQKFDFVGSKKEVLENLKTSYANFLQKYILIYPYQFYNFYDFFTTI